MYQSLFFFFLILKHSLFFLTVPYNKLLSSRVWAGPDPRGRPSLLLLLLDRDDDLLFVEGDDDGDEVGVRSPSSSPTLDRRQKKNSCRE